MTIIQNLVQERLKEKHKALVAEAKRNSKTQETYDFQTQLDSSIANSTNPIWIETYKDHFPDYLTSTYIEDDSVYQRQGIDRIVHLKRGKQITIDEKEDTLNNNRMFLEIWSDKERGKPGWLVDSSKTCDYIAYLKIAHNEVHLIPFFELQRMWIRHKDSLLDKYDLKTVSNGKWSSQGIAVPISEVAKLLYT